MIHEGIKHDCCQPFWLTQMRVVAGVTEEGEYQGVEGDRAVLGDLDLREGELTRWHIEVRPYSGELKNPPGGGKQQLV